MSRLFLPVLAVVLVSVGASHAASLEWPSNLVALSSVKSSQLLPIASEDSVELADGSSGAVSSSAAQPEEQSQEEAEEQQVSSASSGSADPIGARLVSAGIPVSVPLPLILAARNGLRTVLTIQEPAVAKVGEVVQHVPTAVSHQSQTVVHDHRRLVTPIVAPAVRTTQVIRQQPPLLWSVASDPRVVLIRN
ncbi:retinin [Drosophila sechellia]|uniref:GM25623 n=1 Tax=Drosophila sechellia TaxID=7238 RepID=B4HJK9_DROSE|nr:retinin [Drosophila sechellia]EDW41736.1 GM25623 [Drosophila sechellia]